MSLILLTTLLALGGADAPAKEKDKGTAAPKTEGRWTIVYAEEGGRRNTAWEARPATLKSGTLSYEDEGTTRSLKLKFGPNQTVTATGLGKDGDKAARGVYIAAQDYLSISLVTSDKAREDGSSGDFILIMRRQRPK